MFNPTKLWRVLALTILSLPVSGLAGTFYIDYANGSDSNSGTSKSTAWKTCPGMPGGSRGNYSHAAGDRFIFKGGVTWSGSCFPLTISNGGSLGNLDYYGVDRVWFAGSSWSRPVFDSGGSSFPRHTLINVPTSYVTIDNIEVTGFYWNSGTQGWGTSMISLNASGTSKITNCYFHNWSHATLASGCKDDLRIIFNTTTGDLVDSCIFNSAPNGNTSGFATACTTVRNSIARNMVNGFLPGTPNSAPMAAEVSGCDIGPINASYDPDTHGNAIEQLSPGSMSVHHNKIHDIAPGITIFCGAPGNLAYIHNNLIWNSGPVPIQFDGRQGTGTAYVYNNTIIYSGSVINNNVGTPWTVTARNNHVIGGSIWGTEQ